MIQQFLDFCAANPDATQADAATALGVSRQRISQLCKREGVTMERAQNFNAPKDAPTRKSLMGREIERFPGSAGNTLVGAVAEIAVCADLMDRGFHVFRSLSTDGPCDLIVLIDGKPFRVEVKTSRRDRSGSVVRPASFPDRYDVFACVLHGPEIHYFSDRADWPLR